MRTLVLTRGTPASGKSYWIKQNNLEQYTLSADNIRLLFQSPVLNKKGGYSISPKNDHKVWKLLFELLEDRMSRGEFTVIDATHTKQSAISQYKQLASKYKYRVFVVDFSDVPLEVILKQNKQRSLHKFVPEEVIENHYTRLETEHVPKWVTVVKPDEFDDVVTLTPRDVSKYKKLHFIGDVHGCNSVLQEYLNNELKDDELYVFLGDYIDRGVENAKVVEFLIDIKDKKNVILLEGNHEAHLIKYANNEESLSRVFNNKTKLELDNAKIDKKELR